MVGNQADRGPASKDDMRWCRTGAEAAEELVNVGWWADRGQGLPDQPPHRLSEDA